MIHIDIDAQTGKITERPLTDGEIAELKKSAMTSMRARRNELLAASDWTMLADAPAEKGAWEKYRQALRDLPEVADLGNIQFPEQPK